MSGISPKVIFQRPDLDDGGVTGIPDLYRTDSPLGGSDVVCFSNSSGVSCNLIFQRPDLDDGASSGIPDFYCTDSSLGEPDAICCNNSNGARRMSSSNAPIWMTGPRGLGPISTALTHSLASRSPFASSTARSWLP